MAYDDSFDDEAGKAAWLPRDGRPALYYIGDDYTIYRIDLAHPEKTKMDARQRALANALLKVADDNLNTVHFEIIK